MISFLIDFCGVDEIFFLHLSSAAATLQINQIVFNSRSTEHC